MPSDAYNTFKYNLIDVDRLIGAYGVLKPTGQGRRGLGHITRSTIFILCATWEQYIEDVTKEPATLFSEQCNHPNDLPEQEKLTLARRVSGALNELDTLNMAGNGWRDVYRGYVQREIDRHNTPKTDNITKLFFDHLGVTDPVDQWWSVGGMVIDDFVSMRGEIAHKGRAGARYVKFYVVENLRGQVQNIARETDGALGDYLAEKLPDRRPWRRGQN